MLSVASLAHLAHGGVSEGCQHSAQELNLRRSCPRSVATCCGLFLLHEMLGQLRSTKHGQTQHLASPSQPSYHSQCIGIAERQHICACAIELRQKFLLKSNHEVQLKKANDDCRTLRLSGSCLLRSATLRISDATAFSVRCTSGLVLRARQLRSRALSILPATNLGSS